MPYRGRIAPSPTGLLHVGHASTFWTAYQRALAQSGTLVLRNEDLDPQRSKPEFAAAMLEDLLWLASSGRKGRMSADLSRHMSRAGAAASTLTPGASCAMVDSFIPAPARVRTWRWP